MKKSLLTLSLLCIGSITLQAKYVHIVNHTQNTLEIFVQEEYNQDFLGLIESNDYRYNYRIDLQAGKSEDLIFRSRTNGFFHHLMINLEIKDAETQDTLYACNQKFNKSLNDELLNNIDASVLLEVYEDKINVWKSLDAMQIRLTHLIAGKHKKSQD